MHFFTVFTREDTSVFSYLHSELPPNNNATLLDSVTTFLGDVHQVLLGLDMSKACGLDLICQCLLKEAASEISSSLASLFNKSLQDGSLPEDWVSANISPVFKKAINKHLISNYRPISLTSVVSKVLERLT